MKIAFYVSQFSLRGTEVATFDYARFAQELLDHEPLIIAPNDPANSVPEVEHRFASRFEVIKVDEFAEVDRVIDRAKVDLFYILKAGQPDGRLVRSAPNAVHIVFPVAARDTHGERPAFISEWLARRCTGIAAPCVPHIVTMPAPTGDLRKSLGIPPDATVFGCYGGSSSFDILAAQRAVMSVVERRSDAFFIFMNITPFAEHERIKVLPGSADRQQKANFIATTDAMLHARHLGESFGIACGEFSILNRPVITYAFSAHRAHLEILGSKALTYSNQSSLERILLEFDAKSTHARSWDAYSTAFSPAEVMKKFDQVFLDTHQTEQSMPVSNVRQLVERVRGRLIRLQDAASRSMAAS